MKVDFSFVLALVATLFFKNSKGILRLGFISETKVFLSSLIKELKRLYCFVEIISLFLV